MLPSDQVAEVRAAVERYRERKARLEEEANAGLAALVVELGSVARRQRA